MMSLPCALFRHILSFRGPIYEYVRRFGAPSARWVDEYTIVSPCVEYEFINGRIVILYWDMPISVHRDRDIVWMPTRASF